MDLEQALKAEVDAAKTAYKQAVEVTEREVAKADKLVARARAERKKVSEQAKSHLAGPAERVRRSERAYKVYRGEPLTQKYEKVRNGSVPDEVLAQILGAADAFVTGDEQGTFTVADILRNTEGINRETINEALPILRREGKIRRAGVGRRGVNKVHVYRVEEGVE